MCFPPFSIIPHRPSLFNINTIYTVIYIKANDDNFSGFGLLTRSVPPRSMTLSPQIDTPSFEDLECITKREMAEMLCLSRRVSEAMVRQIFPNATDEELDGIVDEVFSCGNAYPGIGRLNPLCYPNWVDFVRENFGDISAETLAGYMLMLLREFLTLQIRSERLLFTTFHITNLVLMSVR